MRIASISFCGKKEILGYASNHEAKNNRPLTAAEKNLVNTACEFHDLEVESTSDGDWLASPHEAQDVSKRYLDALHNVGASKMAYLTAVDTLMAPVISYRVSPIFKEQLVSEALEIAKKADDVTKFDVIKDIPKFD